MEWCSTVQKVTCDGSQAATWALQCHALIQQHTTMLHFHSHNHRVAVAASAILSTTESPPAAQRHIPAVEYRPGCTLAPARLHHAGRAQSNLTQRWYSSNDTSAQQPPTCSIPQVKLFTQLEELSIVRPGYCCHAASSLGRQ